MTKLSPDAMERVKRRGGGGWWYGVRAVVFSNVQVLSINNMASFRNHVFAPISEEFVFRSIIVLLMLAKYRLDAVNSTTHTVAWEIARMCPLWFGVAHMHHAIEKVAKIGMPVKIVLMQTLVQLTYTSVFGYMACLLLLRTGTVIAPITSHMICNFMGLPDVGFIFAPGHSSSSEMSALHTYRIVITAVHLGGLVSFAYLLCPLTESLVESSALWSLRAAPALSV
jgi:prenyl protein peptidase